MARDRFVSIALCLILFTTRSECAPKRTKKGDPFPHTVYDQKQTGDYNIQFHLKDFQIIAVLGDETAGFGDYDYTYDYSDFTIKPASHKPSTHKPTEPSFSTSITPSSSPKPSILTTTKPPYPFVNPSADIPQKQPSKPEEKPLFIEKPKPLLIDNDQIKEKSSTTENPSTSEKPSTQKPIEIETKKPVDEDKPQIIFTLPLVEEKPSEKPINDKPIIDLNLISLNSTIKTPKLDEINSPGKIKVQIIETPVNVGVVPGEDIMEGHDSLPHGEILHFKRCAQGFTRDKRGRCRRVRRPASIQPQLSYKFSRLASNIASRFRQSEENSASSSDSKEDLMKID